MRPTTNMWRPAGTPPTRKSAPSCAASIPGAWCSTVPAAPRWKRRICTNCWRACTATTTCPTARICAMKAPRWRCPKPSAWPAAPSCSTTSRRLTASSFFGQNVGVNSPRMLHQLQEARQRGVEIITFNPLRERGLVSFVNPQSPTEMLTGKETVISTQYHQVKAGGDTAAIMGLCKAVLAADDAASATGKPRVLDTAFLDQHTHGFDAFAASVRACGWEQIESTSGLRRADLEAAAAVYVKARAVIGIYGMGLTQHRNGVQNVEMVSNFLLMRGNMGKPGAGICPVRGHSNVQGQRTVGITEKPELAPRDKGMNTVEACEGILARSVHGFVSLGGNFVRAIPETVLMEQAWRELRLTVQISTKLNRSHLIHGEIAYILPCLGRIEIDRQNGVEQSVSVEDSTGCMHGSRGRAEPAGRSCARSQPSSPASPRRRWRRIRASTGTAGAPTTRACATPSSRPIQKSSASSTRACGRRAASASRCRPPSGSGRRRPARPTSSRQSRSTKTPT